MIGPVNDHLAGQRRLYEGAGMHAIRWFADIARTVQEPPPADGPPAGIQIVGFSRALSDAVRQWSPRS
jgi:hypothetical protein